MAGQRCNEALLKSIAKKLRELRKQRGLSQVDALIDTDIHVARVESGRQNVSISTLFDLCKYYGVTLEDFFRDINAE